MRPVYQQNILRLVCYASIHKIWTYTNQSCYHISYAICIAASNSRNLIGLGNLSRISKRIHRHMYVKQVAVYTLNNFSHIKTSKYHKASSRLNCSKQYVTMPETTKIMKHCNKRIQHNYIMGTCSIMTYALTSESACILALFHSSCTISLWPSSSASSNGVLLSCASTWMHAKIMCDKSHNWNLMA